MTLKESPSQTAGPYVHIGCAPQTIGLEQRRMGPELGRVLVEPGAETISLELTVLDGEDAPLKDALIEIWQAGPDGSYNASGGFRNWGRAAMDLTTGVARFETLRPGVSGDQAPHILIWIVARGINLGLTTRLYFPEEDNQSDPTFILAGARAQTLVATKTPSGYTHVIRLQGDHETVFFDV